MWRNRNCFGHLGGAWLTTALLMTSWGPPAAADAGGGNRIHSIELLTEASGEVVEVVASQPMVWLGQRHEEKRLVVELPGVFPGPEVEEIATFGGLVAAVLLETEAAEPRTRIVVLTRGPALTSLVPRGNRLRIELTPAPAAEPAAEPDGPRSPVEEPAAAPPAVHPASEAAGERIYELQLGLFSVEENATGWAADLERRGYPAYVVEVTNAAGQAFHTVRLGPYATRQQARRAAAAYRSREGGETLIRWRPRPAGDER